jgi:hypothetical protein
MSLRRDSPPTLKDVKPSQDVGVVAKLFGNLKVAPIDELDTEAPKRYRDEQLKALEEADKMRMRNRPRPDSMNYFEDDSEPDEDPDYFLLRQRRDANPGRPAAGDPRVPAEERRAEPFALRTNNNPLTSAEKVVNIEKALNDANIGLDKQGLDTSTVQAFKKAYPGRYNAATRAYVNANNNFEELNEWANEIKELIIKNRPITVNGLIPGGETPASVTARLEQAADAWATQIFDLSPSYNNLEEKAIAISNSIATFLQIARFYTREKNDDPRDPMHRRHTDYYIYIFGTLDSRARYNAKRDFYFARAKANRMIVSDNDRRLTYAEKSELARNEMPGMGIDIYSAYSNVFSTTFATMHPGRYAEAQANREDAFKVFRDEFPDEFESTKESYWLEIASANGVTFVESRQSEVGIKRTEETPEMLERLKRALRTYRRGRTVASPENAQVEDGDVNEVVADDAENVTEGNETAFDSNATEYNRNYENAMARTLATFKGGSRGSSDSILATYPGLYGLGMSLGNVFTQDYFHEAKDPNFDFYQSSIFIRYPNSEVYYGNPEMQEGVETLEYEIQDRIDVINAQLVAKHGPGNGVYVRLPNYAADPYNNARDSLDVRRIKYNVNADGGTAPPVYEVAYASLIKRKRVYTDKNLEDEMLPIEPDSLLSKRFPNVEYVWVYNDPIKLKLRSESRADLGLLTPGERAYAKDLAQQIGNPNAVIAEVLNAMRDAEVLNAISYDAPPSLPPRPIAGIDRNINNTPYATLADYFEFVANRIESESKRLAKQNTPEIGKLAWTLLSTKIRNELKREKKKRTDIEDDLAPTDENMLPMPDSPIWLDAKRLLYFVNNYRYTDQAGTVKMDTIYHMDRETFETLLEELLSRIPEEVEMMVKGDDGKMVKEMVENPLRVEIIELAEAMHQLEGGLPSGENPLLNNITELLKFTDEKINKLQVPADQAAMNIRAQVPYADRQAAEAARLNNTPMPPSVISANNQLRALVTTLNANKTAIRTTLKARIQRQYVKDTFKAYWAKYIQPDIDRYGPMPPPPPPTGDDDSDDDSMDTDARWVASLLANKWVV